MIANRHANSLISFIGGPLSPPVLRPLIRMLNPLEVYWNANTRGYRCQTPVRARVHDFRHASPLPLPSGPSATRAEGLHIQWVARPTYLNYWKKPPPYFGLSAGAFLGFAPELPRLIGIFLRSWQSRGTTKSVGS